MALVKFKDNFPSFIDEFLNGEFNHSNRNAFSNGVSLPAVNVKEKENSFVVEVASPGMKKEDFKIELDNNILEISSEYQDEVKNENEKFSRREFKYASFKRSFKLPELIDAENISANYENGILNISIPKKEEVKPKSKLIAIK